ncbi:hypothetical protein ACFLYS_02750 [Chloroflexota bacterium]
MRTAAQDMKETNPYTTRHYFAPRTTIGLKQTTKEKLDNNRAPGQCYDGFIYQLVDLWERSNGK